MEEYITRAEFDRLLKEEVRRQLKEQRQTDEMKVINVNVASADVTTRLDTLDNGLKELRQEFHTVYTNLYNTLQEHYDDHTASFKKIEESMATMKEDIIDAIRKYSQPGGNGH